MTAPSPARAQRRTRQLTGRPSWPIMLLAGVEKSGKTYLAVEASASELVGETYLVGLGEDDPDEYGAVPGQRVRLVEHDGTYRDVLEALRWAAEQPPADPARPNLLVLDSGTRLWNLLSDQAQDTANRRRKTVDAQITMDLWNTAAQRWAHVMDVLRDHQGPSIITARLDLVTAVEGGKPVEGERRWREQGHKSLPFDVGAIVHLRQPATPGHPAPAVLRGVRSLRVRPDQGTDELAFPEGVTVEALWRGLGLADEPAGERRHHGTHVVAEVPDDQPTPPRQTRQAPQQQPQEPPAQPAGPQQTSAPAPAPQQPAQDLHPSLRAVAVKALESRDVEELSRTYGEAAERQLLEVDVRAALDAEDREVLEVQSPEVPIPLGRLLQACGAYARKNGCAVRWARLDEAQHRDQQTPTARAS